MPTGYPFVANLGRGFYGPALPNYTEDPVYGQGPQTVLYPGSTQISSTLKFSVGAAAVIGAGFIPYDRSNVFSKFYMPAIRGIEEYSPGKILRTFQMSNMLSQFESAGRATRFIAPEALADPSLQQYLTALGLKDRAGNILDFGLSEVRNRGLVFHQGQLYHGLFSEGLENIVNRGSIGRAAIIRNINQSPRFSEAIGHHLGQHTPLSRIFGKPMDFMDEAGNIISEPFQIVAGKNTAQLAYRQVAGYGTGLVERFNRLSGSFIEETPLIGKYLTKGLRNLGINPRLMSVTPGPGLKTLGKLTAKWGALIGAAYLGYGTIDSIMDRVAGKGPTEALADAYVSSRLAYAKFGDATGFRDYAERQEEVAPGSTSLTRLFGFPMLGAAGGGLLHFVQNTITQFNVQGRVRSDGTRVSLQEASDISSFLMSRFNKGGPGTRWFHRLGRWLQSSEILGEIKPSHLKVGIGAAIGAAAVLPFIPGALAPNESYEDLKRIYSGEQNIAVRKNRFWEFGRTPWEGTSVSYFRPHWYPLMKTGARDIGIYGEEMSPLKKFYLANFTYDLEAQHYYDRPYPITGTAFEDVPILGPALAATVGRFVKPPRLMHQEEFMTDEGYMYQPMPFGGHWGADIGAIGPGAPINPYGNRGFIGEQVSRLKDVVGLPGWAIGAIKGAVTGEDELFSQETQLESARRMYGAERTFWDRELGGLGPVGEVFRRLFPHRRREVPLYNPIRNTMPSWLPGPGERGQDFLHGDPYAKIPYGEVRLPGKGYETLHPELEGVNPEDYPDIYKLKILADVAPYSDQFKQMQFIVLGKKRSGQLSPAEAEMLATIREEKQEKNSRKQFFEYRYKSSDDLASYNEELQAKGSRPIGFFEGLIGRYWESVAHNAETPLEYLTPISPASKFINVRSAIEDYEASQLYGTRNAFWDAPIRDFLVPFTRTTAHALGIGGIPEEVQQKRKIKEYFDVLKYVKFSRLQQIAIASKDGAAAAEFELLRRETLTGVNPYTMDFTRLYRSLPTEERDYFESFASEQDPKARENILSMIPENERGLFIARWNMARANQLREDIKSGKLVGAEAQRAQAEMDQIYEEARNEGFPKNDELNQEYLATRMKGESYPDWFRRTRAIPSALAGRTLPGADFVGYHPGVDLEDIKLKLVQNLGFDMHDFNLWPSNQMNLARRPFINDEAIEDLDPKNNSMGPNEIRSRIRDLLTEFNVDDASISIAMYPSAEPGYNVNLDVSEDRSEDIKEAYRRGI